jgi:hypothetical protein
MERMERKAKPCISMRSLRFFAAKTPIHRVSDRTDCLAKDTKEVKDSSNADIDFSFARLRTLSETIGLI